MRRIVARSAALCGLLLVTVATAQPPANVLPQPRVTIVFPVGAKAGTAVDVTVTGTDIDDPTALLFSSPDIKAELTVAPEPKPDPKAKEQPKKGRTGPQTSAKFKITVPASVQPGTYDVRVVGKFGVSNPRAFVVGERPEETESAKPHNDVPDAQKIELNTTVNGTIQNTADVDYYAFAGKAGTRVLVSCLTSSIDSKARPLVEVFDKDGKRLAGSRNYRDNDALADATLPADGEYFVRVCEFAYQSGSAEHFYRLTVTTGPWIDAVYPPAVQPGKPAQVTLYGRNLPGGKIVDGMKIEGRPVESTTVTVNPPAERGKLAVRGSVAPPQALNDGFEFRLPGSNAVPIYLTDVPVAVEKGSENDTPGTAEVMTVPGEIAGRIEKRGDKDWYAFQAKKGEVFYVELFADRIGSGMDMYFGVKAGTEKYPDISGEQDDDTDILHPQSFFNRSGDPAAYKFTAPNDGMYLILVASREANTNFGPRSIYRLRVAKPSPDFRAVVMAKDRSLPTATVAGQGADVALDVFVSRADGFTGAVTATAEGLPAGVTAKPALIGTGQKWGTLILSTSESAAAFTGAITVKCTAQIDGKPVSRSARPATITWGVQPMQNIPTVARLDEQLVLAVRPEKAFFKLALDLPNAKVKTKDKEGKDVDVKLESPLYVKAGDKITLPVKATWQGAEPRAQPLNVTLEATGSNIQTAPLRAGQGGNNQPAMTMAKDKNDGVVTVDVRAQADPGTYQLVLAANTQVAFARDPSKKDQKTNAVVVSYSTPLEVIVVPSSLGKFTVTPPANNRLTAGTTAELTVKVERAADYAGEFKVMLVLPKDTKGLTAKEVTIPAGKDEVTIPVTVDKDAKAGGLNNVSVTATGVVHGKFPIAHEVKVNNLQVVAEPKKK